MADNKFYLTKEIKRYIDQSVLCWLATSSKKHVPNVSPKEIFTYFGEDAIIIANIASPQTVRNIRQNNKACISFIDVFTQKGFQLKGEAQILEPIHENYSIMKQTLEEMTEGKFPFSTITYFIVSSAKRIVAPRYIFYPDTKEDDQIRQAKAVYHQYHGGL